MCMYNIRRCIVSSDKMDMATLSPDMTRTIRKDYDLVY